jgi:hypothetical protein
MSQPFGWALLSAAIRALATAMRALAGVPLALAADPAGEPALPGLNAYRPDHSAHSD